MKITKKKVYVLMVSRVFPATHLRKGEETHFKAKILKAGVGISVHKDSDGFGYYIRPLPMMMPNDFDPKITTIRENYDLWARRAEKINAGEAVLSLRQWSGSPYNYKRDGSKPVEFLQLEKIGVQRMYIEDHRHGADLDKFKNIFANVDYKETSIHAIAKNDGLSYEDFLFWFGLKLGSRMEAFDGCVIHFTSFKY